MDNMYDVAIIGAGISGLFIAYELAQKKLRVLVVDKKSEPGFGVSKAHAAIIHVVQLPFKSLKSRLAREGNKMYDEICRRLGVKLVRLRTLVVARNPLHLLLLPFMYWYLKRNIGSEFPVSLVLSRKKLKKIEPGLSRRVLGGIVIGGYGIVNPFDLMYALYEFSIQNGVDFRFNTEVTGIRVEEDYVEIITSSGVYRSHYLINAAGLYADDIARMVGDSIKIELGKGVLIVFEKTPLRNIVAPAYLIPSPKTKGGAAMLTTEGRGIWGPNLTPIKSKENVSVEERDVKSILGKFSPLIDGDLGVPLKAFAGVRPIPEGNDFVIRFSSNSKRVIHVAGIESPGFTAAPAIAKRVLALLSDAGLNLVKKEEIFERIPPRRLREIEVSEAYLGRLGKVVCICNMVSEAEVREAIRRGSRTLQGVMFRTGAGMGLCQGSMCVAEILRIMSGELKVSLEDLTLRGGGSWIVKKRE